MLVRPEVSVTFNSIRRAVGPSAGRPLCVCACGFSWALLYVMLEITCKYSAGVASPTKSMPSPLCIPTILAESVHDRCSSPISCTFKISAEADSIGNKPSEVISALLRSIM